MNKRRFKSIGATIRAANRVKKTIIMPINAKTIFKVRRAPPIINKGSNNNSIKTNISAAKKPSTSRSLSKIITTAIMHPPPK